MQTMQYVSYYLTDTCDELIWNLMIQVEVYDWNSLHH